MNKRNFFCILFIVFSIKIITLFFFINYLEDKKNDLWITLSEDDEGYLSCVENYIEFGELFYDGKYSGNSKMYAPRVPGQNISYLTFRYFFSKNISINLLIIFQCLFYSISISLIVSYYAKNLKNRLVLLIVAIIAIDTYSSYYNNIPSLADSLNISFTIFSFYFLLKYTDKRNYKYLIFLGIFTSITFFFRVTSILNISLVGFTILYLKYFENKKILSAVKLFSIFILPFILFESFWVIRNKSVADKFIFLQEMGRPALHQNDIFSCKIRFCQAFGGDYARWNPKSAILWFENDQYLKKMKFDRPDDSVFPDYIFSENSTLNDLKDAREHIWRGNEDQAIKIINKMTKKIKENNPIHYYFLSRIKYSWNLFFQSPTYYYPYSFNNANFTEKAIKLSSLIIYIIIVLTPLFFLPFYFINYKKARDIKINFFYTFTFSYILFYAFLFKTSEFRYNLMSYIGFLVLTICIIDKINYLYIMKKKNS